MSISELGKPVVVDPVALQAAEVSERYVAKWFPLLDGEQRKLMKLHFQWMGLDGRGTGLEAGYAGAKAAFDEAFEKARSNVANTEAKG